MKLRAKSVHHKYRSFTVVRFGHDQSDAVLGVYINKLGRPDVIGLYNDPSGPRPPVPPHVLDIAHAAIAFEQLTGSLDGFDQEINL